MRARCVKSEENGNTSKSLFPAVTGYSWCFILIVNDYYNLDFILKHCMIVMMQHLQWYQSMLAEPESAHCWQPLREVFPTVLPLFSCYCLSAHRALLSSTPYLHG